MPLLQLNLTCTQLEQQRRKSLSTGLSQLMSEILRKRKDLTVINLIETAHNDWSLGGQTLSSEQWCASLNVYITDGTNTDEEISEFIHNANHLIEEIMQTPALVPVYIIVNQIKSNCWGYAGQTQLARKLNTA